MYSARILLTRKILSTLLTLWLFIFTAFNNSEAQKSALKIEDLGNWESVVDIKISNDGKFVGSISSKQLLTVTSTKSFRATTIEKVSSLFFTENSQNVIYRSHIDSLFIWNLFSSKKDFLGTSQQEKLSGSINSEWVGFVNTNKTLLLYNIGSKKTKRFERVRAFFFIKPWNTVLIEAESPNPDGQPKSMTLFIYDLNNEEKNGLWVGRRTANLVFNKANTAFAFVGYDSLNSQNLFAFNFKDRKVRAISLKPPHLDTTKFHVSNNSLRFGSSETTFFLQLELKDDVSKNLINAEKQWQKSAQIYDYRNDIFSMTEIPQDTYGAIADIKSGELKTLTNPGENISSLNFLTEIDPTRLIIYKQQGNLQESSWRFSVRPLVSAVSVIDRTKTTIYSTEYAEGDLQHTTISPDGQFSVYFSRKFGQYICHNFMNGKSYSITDNIPYVLNEIDNDLPDYPFAYGYYVAAWVKNEPSILVYDQFDIWKVDLLKQRRPINVTNGYGRRKGIVLRLTSRRELIPILDAKSTILLSAFDVASKKNGFYTITLKEASEPVLKVMEDAIFDLPSITPSSFVSFPYAPVKAKYAEAYVVRKMTASNSPNFFYTNDFVHFTQVTFVSPEKRFNWIRATLIRWEREDGSTNEGILYTPDDFDSTKSYPVIFNFYERMSNGLNAYIQPDFSVGNLNIPDFVSNGYLVFCPDITYRIGEPGKSAYDVVYSAGKFFKSMKWVDSTKMGLQGHSWGAYQVNMIVSQTKMFKAAASVAGRSDMVSLASDPWAMARSEVGQGRLGGTLWQNVTKYIDNSPIFFVNNISTPLLLLYNKTDNSVPFQQGLELFYSLRRLKKSAWLLQYGNSGHQLEGDDARDYSIRLKQFFNHYLKKKPAPKWMTTVHTPFDGISNDEFQIDVIGICGLNCEVCNQNGR